MKIKKLSVLLAAALALALIGTPALAIDQSGTSSKDVGLSTIQWDSSFQKLDYDINSPSITLKVDWSVIGPGSAAYSGVSLRGKEFTPRGKDPAEGTSPSMSPSGSYVDVTLSFTDLHATEEGEMGNAHLTLYLLVDDDGVGATPVIPVKCGFNLHVEDPA